jgi:hypothetical protein
MKTTPLPANPGFDLIGDIHGHAAPLRRLLSRLGYTEADGCFRHPSRKVIFLGDFIDRGPEIRETLRLVRAMVAGGAALAVMGNHEFNALCYHTLGSDGQPLRKHSAKNKDQHQATLNAFAEYPEEWREYLAWFWTLPLYLDLGDLRVVHAVWDEGKIAALNGNAYLNEALLLRAARKDTPENQAVEVLLKGREIDLPEGLRLADKEGRARAQIRTKWWLRGAGRTYRDLIFPDRDDVPAVAVADELAATLPGYAEDGVPVFVGHYWLPSHHPKAPVTANVACLDYSVAKGGPLVAYRWNGAGPLAAAGFVAVE